MRFASGRAGLAVFAMMLAAISSGASAREMESAQEKLALPKPAALVLSKDLGSEGALALDMNVGELQVVRNPEGHKIELKIQPGRFEDEARAASWVRRFEVVGEHAVIDLELPKDGNNHHGSEVTISVPAETALKVSLGVGQLIVEGIRGDKDLNVGVGQMTVRVADSSEYGPVEASVAIGDVEAAGFGMQEKGGFFRAVKAEGRRTYRLSAHVGIGDVVLKQEAGVERIRQPGFHQGKAVLVHSQT